MTDQRVSYGRWLLGYGELYEPYSEQEARRRDAAGEEYWVIFGDPDHPWKVMQVSPGKVDYYVVWLDHLLRPISTHLFVPEDDNDRDNWDQRLFLQQVHFKEYDDDIPPPRTGAARAGGSYFSHDGSAYHARNLGNGRETGESPPMDPAQADLLLFEDHYPVFGEWDSITRLHRDQPTP